MTGAEDSSFITSTPSKKDRRKSKNKVLRFLRRRWVIYGLLASLLLAFVIVVILAAILGSKEGNHHGQPRKITVRKGAVVADHEVCSRIGRDVLVDGGSAVDATVATLLCNGIMAPHSMGIGGGCFMVIYDAQNKKTLVIDGRETAPLSSSQETFANESGYIGPKFIAVPGEIATYWKAHQRYGKLPWKRLFEPSINLLENGFHVSHAVERAMKIVMAATNNSVCEIRGIGEIFCDKMGQILPEGSFVQWPKLAETYKQLADVGPDYMYKGKVAETMAQEIKNLGGIFTKEDFESYSVKESSGIHVDLGDMILLTHGAPSGGPVMGLTMKILEGMGINEDNLKDTPSKALAYHKMIEAIKLSYGERFKLGDEDFVDGVKELVEKMISEEFAANLRGKIDLTKTHDIEYYANATEAAHDQGTAHVSVLSPEGDAVSVTSTVNTYFGSLTVSESTGIIWNNEMADFSLFDDSNLFGLKATVPNKVQAGKRPLSSMAPAIFVDKKTGSVRMIIGNAGGSRITTTNIQIAVRNLWMGQDIEDAVREKRLHHQLDPNFLVYEFGYPQDVLEELKKYGHELKIKDTFMSVVQAVSRNMRTEEINGFSDERKFPGKAMFYTTEEDVFM
ncbi:glutathione hydrolase 1 proenzyme-like [Mytilus edulis]|uniref:glutathione hydrolase 1 proenzyme-like n=1 Tax=Mytilus edulis TaxID=6550 RepID=UPI0039EE2582